ncbi:MAG: aldo/keto reductase, partial [Lachnospiraceae bacterium]|nr:aldo/keto reductase [Lachnospiraceae bacterium]
MKYRELKRCSNLKVSEIALGCEGFIDKTPEEFKEMLERALELGINFIDMYTPNPVFRDNLGAAMKGRREKFVLQGHICSVWEDGQYLRTRNIEKAKAGFEDQLQRLGTDYLDIGMIHYVDGESNFEEVFQGEIIEYCKELKAEGKIHAIGLSSHNPVIARKAVETGLIDVLMFSVNAAYDMQPASEDCNDLFDPANYQNGFEGINSDRKALYELCAREDVAIDVMKVFGGGD